MRFTRLTSEELAAALAATPPPFVLDTRAAAEFEAGHIPGARNVPVHELARRPRDLPSSRIVRIVLVADPGKRGEAAAAFLALQGHTDVALVEGGIAAHRGPLETGPSRRPPGAAGPELRVLP